MDKEKLAQEKQRLLEHLTLINSGTEEYKNTLEDLTNLQKLENSMNESEAKVANELAELELEKAKLEQTKQLETKKIRTERRGILARIGVAVIGMVGSAALALFTIKEEETRAITSKADQKAREMLKVKF